MVSSTLYPAVHILGSQNVYSRAAGIADHYWPWAVFFPHYPLSPLSTISLLPFPSYSVWIRLIWHLRNSAKARHWAKT